jgi:hypothetical protein
MNTSSSSNPTRQPEAASCKRAKLSLTVHGVHYKSISELAESFKHRRALLENRIVQRGWTAERAALTPEKPSVAFEGVVYKSHQAVWEARGNCALSTFMTRRKQGLAMEVCLNLKPVPKAAKYEVFGRKFASIAEVATGFGLTPQQLHSRLRNLTLEQALAYRPQTNGRYSAKLLARDQNLAKTSAILYLVQIQFGDRALYKTGVTCKTTAKRLANVNYELVGEWSGSLGTLYALEQSILLEYESKLCRAPEWFEGKTETFDLSLEESQTMLKSISRKLSERCACKVAPGTSPDGLASE